MPASYFALMYVNGILNSEELHWYARCLNVSSADMVVDFGLNSNSSDYGLVDYRYASLNVGDTF